MDIKSVLMNAPEILNRLSRIDIEPEILAPIICAKVKLLWNCNLSCAYCKLPEQKAMMSRKTVNRLLTSLKADHGLMKVHFSGGEVFLHPDIFGILEDAAGLALQVNLTTNGTLLDKTKLRNLIDLSVHSISFSLDSANADVHDRLRGKKGAFKKTLKAIEFLADKKRKRPKIRINTVVSAYNVRQLYRLRELLEEFKGIASWKLIPVDSKRSEFLLNREDVDILLRTIDGSNDATESQRGSNIIEKPQGLNSLSSAESSKKETFYTFFTKGQYGQCYKSLRCYFAWIYMFIDPMGYCYPCCMSRGKIPSYGKYPDKTIAEILTSNSARQFKMALSSNIRLEPCKFCDDFINENLLIKQLLSTY
ncbi:Radical SAM domain protein [Candidatus Magnetoovum chiemensis]|nr:Radical SAM domain protein [Candidatus Magnetoovum chiemensis]